MPFDFNEVKLCVVTINEKPWKRVKEACMALECGKATKTAHVIKGHVSPENYAQKYKLSNVCTATTLISWPKDSQKYDIYINEEGMYELVLEVNNQKQKTSEDTVLMCCFYRLSSSSQAE